MDETLQLKAALASLLDHMAGEGHGGLLQHADCQACLDSKRAYMLLGVEYEHIDVETAVTMMPMATA